MNSARNRFRWINGRVVLDSPDGTPRLWRCPHCQWWQQWQDEKCRGCGAPREPIRSSDAPDVESPH